MLWRVLLFAAVGGAVAEDREDSVVIEGECTWTHVECLRGRVTLEPQQTVIEFIAVPVLN
jgi:hypothetical protein